MGVELLEDRLVFSAFTVTSTADAGPGTLRQAIADAAANGQADTIVFSPDLAGQTIELSSNDADAAYGPTALVIQNDNISLQGDISAAGITLAGDGLRRLFAVDSASTLTLSGLTLSGGVAQGAVGSGGAGSAGLRGAAYVDGGTLNVQGVTLSDDQAVGGAGDANLGTGTIGFAGGNGQGGAIYNNGGRVQVINSTFTGDVARGGVGGAGDTTGAAGAGEGGAIYNRIGTLTVSSTTLSGNTADQGGRDIYSMGDGGSATVWMNNSIVGQADTAASDFEAQTANGGDSVAGGDNNLIRVAVNFSGTALSADPLLGAPANNGGPTQTLVPQAGSPAIDAGSNGDAAGLSVDQAGRQRIQGGHIDLGAFETTGTTTTPGTNGSVNSAAVGADGTLYLAYYDTADQDLKFATRSTTGIWSDSTTIDSAPAAGQAISLALDRNGLPGVAYRDGLDGTLKYAHFDGSQWTARAIDAGKKTGLFPSLSYSFKNRPVIAYYSKGLHALRLAMYTGSAWNDVTVDASADVGSYVTLGFSALNGVWTMAYVDSTHGSVKFAQPNKAGTAWTGGAITPATTAGGAAYTGLAFNTNGWPLISYLDTVHDDLQLLSYSGRRWSSSAITAPGAGGTAAVLHVGPSGADVLAYNAHTGGVFVSEFAPTGWQSTALNAGGGSVANVSGAWDASDYLTTVWQEGSALVTNDW